MTLSDFEKQLKQHIPEEPSKDVAELFYQCGWDAREAAGLPVASNSSKQKRGSAFLVGMICGLMAAVGLFLWNPAGSTNNQPSIARPESQTDPPQNMVVETTDKLAVTNKTVPDAEPEPSQFNWQASDMFATHRLSQGSGSPLSLVAQKRWSQQMRASQSNWLSSAANTNEGETSPNILRASPMDNQLLNELLL